MAKYGEYCVEKIEIIFEDRRSIGGSARRSGEIIVARLNRFCRRATAPRQL